MKAKKGFTLLELLVAMAIIAVLLALAIFGILQVQKNSRETQRRKALEDINLGINDFYSRYGQNPEYIEFDDDEAKICENIGTCNSANVIVPLKNSARSNNPNNTTTNGTEYYFRLLDDGYQLGFCREDDSIENAGTSPDLLVSGGQLNCEN